MLFDVFGIFETNNLSFFSRFFEMDEIGSKKGEHTREVRPFVRQITEDGKPKLEVYRPTTNPIYIWTQVGFYFLVFEHFESRSTTWEYVWFYKRFRRFRGSYL